MSDAKKEEKYPKKVTTKFRVSYPSLIEASSYDDAQAKKFSVVALFDKNDPKLKELKDFAMATARKAWGDNIPDNVRKPFMDGDSKPDKDGYPGHIYCNFKSKDRPGMVDHARAEILDASEIYGGCYARATVTCYAYGQGTRIQGNKPPGVAFGLQNIQKLGDGVPFSSRGKAEDDFDAVEPMDPPEGMGEGADTSPESTSSDVDNMFD